MTKESTPPSWGADSWAVNSSHHPRKFFYHRNRSWTLASFCIIEFYAYPQTPSIRSQCQAFLPYKTLVDRSYDPVMRLFLNKFLNCVITSGINNACERALNGQFKPIVFRTSSQLDIEERNREPSTDFYVSRTCSSEEGENKTRSLIGSNVPVTSTYFAHNKTSSTNNRNV